MTALPINNDFSSGKVSIDLFGGKSGIEKKEKEEKQIDVFDFDKDGKLNYAEQEAKTAYEQVKEKLKFDINGDGKLSDDEIAAYEAFKEASKKTTNPITADTKPEATEATEETKETEETKGGVLVDAEPQAEETPVETTEPTVAQAEENTDPKTKFDLDGDGKLNNMEYAAYFAYTLPEIFGGINIGAMASNKLIDEVMNSRKDELKKFDMDGDGELSSAEKAAYKAFKDEEMKKFDMNGDGKIDESEEFLADAYNKSQLKSKFDLDGDGELNENESMALKIYYNYQKEVDKSLKFDADNDGHLDAIEMAEYQKDYEYRAYPWMREIAKEETKPEPKAEPQETEKSSGLWGKAKNLWNSTKEYCSNFKKKYINPMMHRIATWFEPEPELNEKTQLYIV